MLDLVTSRPSALALRVAAAFSEHEHQAETLRATAERYAALDGFARRLSEERSAQRTETIIAEIERVFLAAGPARERDAEMFRLGWKAFRLAIAAEAADALGEGDVA